MSTTTTTVDIRWMIRRDLPEVLAIEELSFPHPWTEEDFIHELRQQLKIGIVATLNKQIVAYAIYAHERGYIDVLNFAVHPEYRRQGVGSLLAEKLHRKLNDRRRRLVVHVADFNLPAQLFWSAVGFRAVGVVEGRFDNCDSYKFVRRMEAVR